VGRFRALLIGIAEYDDPDIRQLPFVTDGLSDVGAALESRGYVVDDASGGSGRVDRTELLTRVWQFLHSAERDDTLLVYLSGHGAHSDDTDYLVPSNASLAWPRLADVCVPLSVWAPFLENTHAASVIFLVDACREGFDEQVMGDAGRRGWSHSKGLEVANRKVAFVFACAPGAVARYVTAEGKEFSLFGKAVQQVADDPDGPSTLAELEVSLAAAMGQIADAHRKPVQEIRVRTECDRGAFVVLPPGSGTIDRASWRQIVSDHPAWDRAAEEDGVAELRTQADQFVARLAEMNQVNSRARADDPWHDPALAQRISEWTGFLLTKVLDKPALSAAEAALLSTVPFVYVSYWSAETARLGSVTPADLAPRANGTGDRGSFERFARGYSRLLRRATAYADGAGTSRQIGWWIFRHWLTRRPESYFPSQIEPLLATAMTGGRLAAETWTAQRMGELLRCFGADPVFLARTDRPAGLVNSVPVAVGTAHEQRVRERLVGYLLAVAHYMAIDAAALPDIIVGHLGIADPVSLPDLLRTVADSRWEPRGGQTRVLKASCGHPAVEVALRQHVRSLDAVLSEAHREAATELDLAPLASLPVHATADLVGPAESAGGPAYTSAGVRFRLDEDRVQQLLMGEQLYGDRSLAIRELYQNALDACRYREARTEYLRRTRRLSGQWQGRITFEQGVDSQGRSYVDCTDNGIGMGVRELSEVFAQAGSRFADLPEFLEEQAAWAQLSPPIELFPNSRFGIGVLSYFMLADEITITTCRLGRDGRPARKLKVSIAGPGNLFRIIDVGPGSDAGTTVRLHLRMDQEAVSCSTVLREVLWVAQYETRVVDGNGTASWPPGQLSTAAMEWVRDSADSRLESRRQALAAAAPHVWWVAGGGRILADGITTDKLLFGAVVNLSGPLAPSLSVNRRTIIGDRPESVERLMMEATPELLVAAPKRVSWDWINRMVEDAPRVADLVAQAKIKVNAEFRIAGKAYGAGRVGCWPLDSDVFTPDDDDRIQRADVRTIWPPFKHDLPDEIVAWRAAAIGVCQADGIPAAADRGAEPVVALPSDVILLSHWVGFQTAWLDPAKSVSTGHLVHAAVKLNRPLHEIAHRLADLGYEVPDTTGFTGDLGQDDVLMVDVSLGGDTVFPGERPRRIERGTWLAESPSWVYPSGTLRKEPYYLDQAEPVPLGHVIAAAVKLRCDANHVAGRLAALGYRIPGTANLPTDLTTDDAVLVRDRQPVFPDTESHRRHGYLDPAHAVPVGHVMEVSLLLRRSVGDVAGRLAALGFSVPDISGFPTDISRRDVELVTSSSRPAWLDPAKPVPVMHVLIKAATVGTSGRDAARRLSGLGFQVPSLTSITDEKLTDADAELLRYLAHGMGGTVPPEASVRAEQVLRSAATTKRDPREVCHRLAALGLVVPEDSALQATGPDDRRMISVDGYGAAPWLDPAAPVPLAYLLRAAIVLARSPRHIAQRLGLFGYSVPDVRQVPDDLTRADLSLLRNAGKLLPARGYYAMLRNPEQDDLVVRVPDVVSACLALVLQPTAVCGRLALLGFTVPDPANMPHDLTEADIQLLKRMEKEVLFVRERDVEGWLDPAVPVPLCHVVRSATKINRDVRFVAERLRQFGYDAPDPDGLLPDDKRLITTKLRLPTARDQQLDQGDGWLNETRPVPLGHLVRASLVLERPMRDVAERLEFLGFQLPDVPSLLARGRPGAG